MLATGIVIELSRSGGKRELPARAYPSMTNKTLLLTPLIHRS